MSDFFSDTYFIIVSDHSKLSTRKPCWCYLVGMRQEHAEISLESKIC